MLGGLRSDLVAAPPLPVPAVLPPVALIAGSMPVEDMGAHIGDMGVRMAADGDMEGRITGADGDMGDMAPGP
jgi:hypothetical protein